MFRVIVKPLRIAFAILIMSSAAFAQMSSSAPNTNLPVTTTDAPPPTDVEILSGQVTLYAMMISRLKADLARREKDWAEYSKPLWIPNPTVGIR